MHPCTLGKRLNTLHLSRSAEQLVFSIEALLDWLDSDDSLRNPANLRNRSAALDRLETLLFDNAPSTLQDRANTLRTEFETLDAALYATIRDQVQAGNGAAALQPFLDDPDEDDTDRYDYRDELVSGVLQLDAPATASTGLEPDSVFYQPTPARHLFALLRQVTLDETDVLMDLGAGLGHVPLIVAACTPARCIGIEIEPAYVDIAERCAASLHLTNATFRCDDARDADFSTTTVFYLYTPFRGAMLRTVLDRLRHEAAKRPIRVCSYGPVTQTLVNEAWLAPVGDVSPSQLARFRSNG